ncbi:MAG: hypothetical protein K2M94_07760 [Paramuribaculum sp.]|nr:hypothetical protein [Paramuribaculum sp.]
MSKYTGKPTTIKQPASVIFDKFSDLTVLEQRLAQLPAEAREKLQNVRFTPDTITFDAPAVGAITLKVTERVPHQLVKFEAQNSPVPFGIDFHIVELDPESSKVSTEFDVDIPMMLKPFIGNKLQDAADKFGETMGNFFA